MRKATIILAAVLTFAAPVAGAQEKGATPQDVVQKIKQAASYLAREKDAGLATFKQKQSDYVWADTYVFKLGGQYFLLDGGERELLVPRADLRDRLWTSRVWPGALLVEGEIRGTWRRSQHSVRIDAWSRLSQIGRAHV